MIYSKNQRFFEILQLVFKKGLRMKIITTLLITAFISPVIKDTTRPLFNRYTISKETKLPANYYTTKTGFFCNMERALQKQTKVAVKFRLGSLEYTQKLEGYNLSTLPSSQ
jgi:hypothetical protein